MRSLTLLAVLLAPASALANNAFPDELEIFAPIDQPARTVIGTNYGAIFSFDGGAWQWACEPAISSTQVSAYGFAADGAMLALSGAQVLRSTDGCTWSGTAPPGAQAASDLFADPTDPTRLALVALMTDGSFALFISSDRGASWQGPTLSAGSSGTLFGVEIARTNGARVYASEYRYGGGTREVVIHRSDDHGATWTDLAQPSLGDAYPFVAAVDPNDADTVWLRLLPSAGGGDELAVSHDGAQTFTVMLSAPGVLSALAVGGDHTVWTADRANHLWRLDPDAGAFALGAGPSVSCLAERAGTLYACGSTRTDGFILGASTDRGATFQPLVTPANYQTLACTVASGKCVAVNVQDSGSPVDAGPTAAPDAGATPHQPPAKSGCGCTSTSELAIMALLVALSARRGRSRTRDGRARRSGRW